METPTSPSSISSSDRLTLALKQIQQLETELTDFQKSSYELEQELEKELTALEDQNNEYKEEIARKNKEIDTWRTKYVQLERELSNLNTLYQDRFRKYKTELHSVRSQLVNIEIMNDNIEQNERLLSINLNDLESKYNDSLEKIALLEGELSYKEELLLKEKLKNQNLQNEYGEIKERLLVAKARNEVGMSYDTGNASMDLSRCIPKLNLIKQLHNMIEQTKFMENRVETLRNTIRPSKMRKVSGKTVYSEPVTVDDSTYSATNESGANMTFFSALSKSTTNESLSHTKAVRKTQRPSLQNPPIQPLKTEVTQGLGVKETEFANHFKERRGSADRLSVEKRKTERTISGKSTIKRVLSSDRTPVRRAQKTALESIQGSPTVTAREVKKLFGSPSKARKGKKGGLLPSLKRFNLNNEDGTN